MRKQAICSRLGAVVLLGSMGWGGLIGGCASGSVPVHGGNYQHAAVAADHAIASQAGLDVLRKGGNAVDAAVATSFTLSVVRPESCGIGGGGFMVIQFSDAGVKDQAARGRLVPRQVALNYREMAPWAVGPDFYEKLDKTASTHGAKAVGIPGTVAGLLTAHEKYGVLDRASVLAPAIRAAESGFSADEHFVDTARTVIRDFERNPAWKDRFRFVWVRMLREGKVKVGDVIRLPEQAAALRLIAEQGAAAFYQGPIALAMVETIRRDGGVMTHEDLLRFRVSSTDPLSFRAFGRTFLTMPPPSSGGVAMGEALGVLELAAGVSAAQVVRGTSPDRSMWSSITQDGTRPMHRQTAAFCHPLIESLKHAFADRAEWLGDPAFVDVPVARLLSVEYISARAATFNAQRTLTPDAYGSRERGAAGRDDAGTSHFSIVDSAGNAVACTETINLEFGSCLAVDTFGFMLNNQMDDFTTRRGQANAFGLKQSDRNLPAAGKRPLSSMTPTIVLDEQGKVEIIAGASGGPRIISGTMQTVLNRVLWDLPAWTAVAEPRVHHQWSPDVVRIEGPFYDALVAQSRAGQTTLIDDLQGRGHRVERIDAVSNVQIIARDGAAWQAACDPRKGGEPAGY